MTALGTVAAKNALGEPVTVGDALQLAWTALEAQASYHQTWAEVTRHLVDRTEPGDPMRQAHLSVEGSHWRMVARCQDAKAAIDAARKALR